MIAARNISLTLAGHDVLRNVTAEFRRGRITAVIGANGGASPGSARNKGRSIASQ